MKNEFRKSPEYIRKQIESHKGIKPYEMTQKTRRNMSVAKKKQVVEGWKPWNFGKTGLYSKEYREKIANAHRGAKCPWWKGGISIVNERIRQTGEFKEWRKKVFERDNWSCRVCGVRGGEIQPHHIQNFATNIKLRFEVNNGVTLCRDCHYLFHQTYGMKNNTLEQITKFAVL